MYVYVYIPLTSPASCIRPMRCSILQWAKRFSAVWHVASSDEKIYIKNCKGVN
jgi:hypothetical protein